MNVFQLFAKSQLISHWSTARDFPVLSQEGLPSPALYCNDFTQVTELNTQRKDACPSLGKKGQIA